MAKKEESSVPAQGDVVGERITRANKAKKNHAELKEKTIQATLLLKDTQTARAQNGTPHPEIDAQVASPISSNVQRAREQVLALEEKQRAKTRMKHEGEDENGKVKQQQKAKELLDAREVMKKRTAKTKSIRDKLLNSQRATTVVAIGASAGGLEALQQFFSAMSPTSGLAFVVVQHLSPDSRSLMAEILSRFTKMPVLQTLDKTLIEPNCVYLIPPNNNMVYNNGHLLLTEYVRTSLNHPIDVFMMSLAEQMRERAIAVIMSGAGTDGTEGIESIKLNDGLVIVQKPETAKFDGMPNSAIQTGLCDFILSPEQIAKELEVYLDYFRKMDKSQTEHVPDRVEDPATLEVIYNVLEESSGVDFRPYKQNTFVRRIERRMAICHQDSMKDYAKLLAEDSEETKTLCKEIFIGVTNFFRDPDVFESLKTEAIYDILNRSERTVPIKVWVAGCSTGEEAYSVAILFDEAMDELHMKRDVLIYATDIDIQAVKTAGLGLFGESAVSAMTPERLSRYFTKISKGYSISKIIRKMVIFAPHNLFSDPAYGQLDLICCRNVMIYFKGEINKRIFSTFHTSLKNDGYLFLGKSESVGAYTRTFIPTKCPKIFKHNKSEKIPIEDFIGGGNNTRTPVQYTLGILEKNRTTSRQPTVQDTFPILLKKYLPPCIIIDGNQDIVHTIGDVRKYMIIPEGKMSNKVVDLIPNPLGIAISNACRRTVDSREPIIYTDIETDIDGEQKKIDLAVLPLCNTPKEEIHFTALLFDDATKRQKNVLSEEEEKVQKKVYDFTEDVAVRIGDLESDLLESQQNLKTMVAELQTVNEEMQTSNEELLTSNEELQSSNEELLSVNEEMHTLNYEYQLKLEEVLELNSDMSNFLRNTRIGILYIDSSLNVRKITDFISREFDVKEQDVGHPLLHISHNFYDVDIVRRADEVMKTLLTKEFEIRNSLGRSYIMRVSPYRTEDNTVKGLVMSFIDIADLKSAYEQIEKLSYALEQMPNTVVLASPEGIIEYVNPRFSEVTGYTAKEVLGKDLLVRKPYRYSDKEFDAIIDSVKKGEIYVSQHEMKNKAGMVYLERVTYRPMYNHSGMLSNILGVSEDINDVQDSVTGLPNRIVFKSCLEYTIQHSKEYKKKFALLYIDTDNFKIVNDTLGHNTGDQLLMAMAMRMKEQIGPNDFISRVGGDEFVILLGMTTKTSEVDAFAKKLVESFNRSFIVNNHELYITISIGIVTYPEGGDDSNNLLRDADMAMYAAKEDGKNNYRFYSRALTERLRSRMALERDMFAAIEHREFVPYFHPIVNVETGEIYSFEALARWVRPQNKVILPIEFISIAENAGLIMPLTECIMLQACQQVVLWRELGLKDVTVSVNLSPKLFYYDRLVPMIKKILKQTSCPGPALILELTESVETISTGTKALEEIRALGISIALDDFGSGYSSLSQLANIPVNVVKIDRQFVANSSQKANYKSVLTAVFALFKVLNCPSVAEGIEGAEQLEMIKDLGCDYFQGFLLCEPLPGEQIIKKIVKSKGVWELPVKAKIIKPKGKVAQTKEPKKATVKAKATKKAKK